MDFTSLWTLWQKYRSSVSLITLLVVVFGAGFQSGRIISPYYASTPIILTDAPQEEVISQLEEIKQTGIAARPTPKPSVAAVTTTAPVSDAEFVASKNSTLYHYKTCPSVSRISPANKVTFKTAQEAEAAGFSPSKCTIDTLKR